MTYIATPTYTILTKLLHRSFWIALLLALLLNGVHAQTTATDGMTPLALAPGAPAGSYGLSGFDNVNLYNGNLNFHLPLLGIGGRGSAQMAMTLTLNTVHWRVEDENIEGAHYYFPVPDGWESVRPGYGPGVLLSRRSGDIGFNALGHVIPYTKTLTRLTFITPDGTEYELRDQLNSGQPLYNPPNQSVSRGTVFYSADGTAMTFISDTTIYDAESPADGLQIYVSGFLMFADGARYRIDNSLVSWIRDRNGNRISFTYDINKRVTAITDSLNRQVTVTYADMLSVMYDQISFKGFGGASRTIKVWHSNLSQALRAGYSIGTYASLFPGLNGDSSSYNPDDVVSSVELPDGRRYWLYYNPYYELARVMLPTGGAIEYDHTAGSGVVTNRQIYRRVIERRVYPDGVALEGKMSYSATYNNPFDPKPWLTNVTVDHRDASNILLAHEKHYFYGSPLPPLWDPNLPISYPAWKESREYQAEGFDSNGTTVLRRGAETWQQAASISWWTGAADDAPSNNPRIADATTTLVETNQVAKQTAVYDQYNNPTDSYEYDYGSGIAGTLLRRTHTDYLTSNVVGGVTYYYDTNTSIHLRRLPVQQQVFDASGNERARTTYEYDNYDPADGKHASLLNRTSISGLDSGFTTSYKTRGNLTRVSRWLLGAPSTEIKAYSQYDIAGNMIKVIDPNNNVATLDFSDRFGAPDGDARANAAPTELSTVGQTSFAFATQVTNALTHTAYTQFDYYLGRPIDSEDPNGTKTSGYYGGLLDRPTQMVRAVGVSGVQSQTAFTYNDASHLITATSDRDSYGDNLFKGEALYDGLGRTTETHQYENASAYVTVKTGYDAMGRPYQISNPYRSGDTVLWTTTAYDALSRLVSVTTPDNAIATTAYSGNMVMVTDQATKKRISQTNGIGQLVNIWEVLAASDPSSVTVSFNGQGYNAYLTS